MFRSTNGMLCWRRNSFARTHQGQVEVVYTVTAGLAVVIGRTPWRLAPEQGRSWLCSPEYMLAQLCTVPNGSGPQNRRFLGTSVEPPRQDKPSSAETAM